MNREPFIRAHEATWAALETLLSRLGSRSPRTVRGEARARAASLPALYRQVCHHLALARARQYGSDLEQRLHDLAHSAHQQLYRRTQTGRGRFFELIAAVFPRRVRAEGRLVWLCAALFFGPLFAMASAVALSPDLVYSVLAPEQVADLELMYAPNPDAEERASSSDLKMFGVYVSNNIGIAFRTFAIGIFFGVGAVFILVYNGVVIGAVFGHLFNVGYQHNLLPFVAGHSSFELLAIVLAGTAGMRLGLALLAPGRASRGAALLAAARAQMPVIYGFTLMLLVAAFIEAFWSSSVTIPPPVRYTVGIAGWLGVLAYFFLMGRGKRGS